MSLRAQKNECNGSGNVGVSSIHRVCREHGCTESVDAATELERCAAQRLLSGRRSTIEYCMNNNILKVVQAVFAPAAARQMARLVFVQSQGQRHACVGETGRVLPF